MTTPAHLHTARAPSEFWGFLLLLLSSLIAIFLIPKDVQSEDALLWSTWFLAIGLLASITVDVALNGAIALIRSVNIVFAGVLVVLLAEPLQPGYILNLDRDIIQTEFIIIGLFLVCIVIGTVMPKPALPRLLRRLATAKYSNHGLRLLIIISFVLGMFNFAIASGFSPGKMIEGLLSSRFDAPWTRGALGGWDAFRDSLTNFGYLLPTLSVLLANQRRRWRSPDVIGSVILSAVLLAFLAQGGGRRVVVVIIGAALIAFLLVNRHRISLRHLAATLGLVLATAVFLDLMLQVRNVGFSRGIRDEFTARSRLRVDDNFRALGEVIKAIPDEHPYVGWGNVVYVAVRPVPRVFWPKKPVDPGFDLATHLGARGVLYSSTAIGECYFSYGWIGVAIGGLVFGLTASCWSTLLSNRTSPIGYGLYGLGAMALFLGMRSFIELVVMSYPIALWLALDTVMGNDLRRP